MLVGDVEFVQNVPQDLREGYAALNKARGIEHFTTQPPHDGVAVIVGGGPSLADFVEEIRMRKQNGQMIWTVNNTYSYLMERGIEPDAHVFLDSRQQNVEFVRPGPRVTYYLDVRCHPDIYEKTSGCKRIMYGFDHSATGHTVGLKALYLTAMSGFRMIHLYGFDSSYRELKHHAYEQPLNDRENVCEIRLKDGSTFLTAPWMAQQADEFQYIANSLAEQDCEIHVHGDGLLPRVAQLMMQPEPQEYYL